MKYSLRIHASENPNMKKIPVRCDYAYKTIFYKLLNSQILICLKQPTLTEVLLISLASTRAK